MIRKAILPAAGFGTRMLHLTRSTPKELLPVAGKPMIEHTVKEVADAGIEQIYIIIRKGKEAVRDYFEEKAGDFPSTSICFVYQEKPLGLGDALHSAKDLIGESPFLMVIPDQLIFSAIPPSKKLIERYDFHEPAILSSMVKIPAREAKYFEGARGFEYDESTSGEPFEVRSIITEEDINRIYAGNSFQVRGFGRTVFPYQIFQYLTEEFINPETGEVDLLKTFKAIEGRLSHHAILLEGAPCDLGTLAGYRYYDDKLGGRGRSAPELH